MGKNRGAMVVSYGWESRGAVLDWRDGGKQRERRGFFCDIGFECGIKLVVVIELRKWL